MDLPIAADGRPSPKPDSCGAGVPPAILESRATRRGLILRPFAGMRTAAQWSVVPRLNLEPPSEGGCAERDRNWPPDWPMV